MEFMIAACIGDGIPTGIGGRRGTIVGIGVVKLLAVSPRTELNRRTRTDTNRTDQEP